MLRRLTLPAAFFVSFALTACLTSDPIDSEGGSSGEGGDGPVADGVGGYVSIGGAGGGIEGGDYCGNKVCAIGETCETCPADCGCQVPTCGDGSCDTDETCEDCPEDCEACPTCGDDICDPNEDCDTCYMDCGVCACAPDGFEPNGGSSSATPIAPATDYCDLSICSGDVDWFAFDVNGTTDVTLDFTHAEGDLELEIFSSITVTYVTGSYSGDDDESVTLTGLQPGEYWARVYADPSAPENPDYCIRVD